MQPLDRHTSRDATPPQTEASGLAHPGRRAIGHRSDTSRAGTVAADTIAAGRGPAL